MVLTTFERLRGTPSAHDLVARWLAEWPRPDASTRALYAQAAGRFSEHFGPTPLGEVERLSAKLAHDSFVVRARSTQVLSLPLNGECLCKSSFADSLNVGGRARR